jgi:hypothetical protein
MEICRNEAGQNICTGRFSSGSVKNQWVTSYGSPLGDTGARDYLSDLEQWPPCPKTRSAARSGPPLFRDTARLDLIADPVNAVWVSF